jgi:hypothetical protein
MTGDDRRAGLRRTEFYAIMAAVWMFLGFGQLAASLPADRWYGVLNRAVVLVGALAMMICCSIKASRARIDEADGD